ncbi:MAG: 4Fe-4S binding protein [Candidatus Aenigmarchaeota archaeon]|nr:4Fe-4S binding protein [Candidatus Aenigmarchaeota archaeon]
MSVSTDYTKCLACGGCVSVCPQNALTLSNLVVECDPKKCTNCKVCVKFCPVGALKISTNP